MKRETAAASEAAELAASESGRNDPWAADAPVCGTTGITPTDSVAVEFMRQAAPARPRSSLVWASRPAVAAPFMAAVARSAGLQVQDGQATVVTLRCRSAPSSDF